MKKLLTFIACTLIALTTHASTRINGIYYNLNSSTKKAEVISNPNKYSGAVSIPSTVTYGGVSYSVTSIRYEAFYDCSSLTSITIPNSVTSIGYDAFFGCSGLTSITIDTANTKYDSRDNCNAIIETASNTLRTGCKNTIIPNSVTSIGNNAFFACTSLTSITIPNSVTSIGNNAFFACTSLTSITIPNSVTNIGEGAFADCTGLTSINIPNSVTRIGNYAFYGCTSLPIENNIRYADTYLVETIDKTLSSYQIKEGTRFIGSSAFSDCLNLTSLTLPNSVTSIGDSSFYGCTGLTSINIPNSVTSIEGCAFEECSSLISIEIPNSVTNIGAAAFSGCISLMSITIPNSVTNINYQAFSGCTSLTSIDIPNNVTCIEFRTFAGCTGLTSITIPNSVTVIEPEAFSGCTGLMSITIPNSVTYIGESAFEECTNLSSVTVNNSSPITIYEETFPNRNNATLYVPEGSKVAYLAADYWKDFKEIIELEEQLITFDDAKTKSLCVANWDLNGDGELSVLEAGDVKSLGTVFNSSDITSFDELKYFTRLTSIGNGAFESCQKLKSITFPNNITSIGHDAFSGCSNMTSVTVKNLYPISIDDGTFPFRENATLYVPYGSKSDYLTANYWREFKEIIELAEENINFADAKAKAICVDNWDTNGDGELSMSEAGAVTSIGTVFSFSDMTSFEELKYFIGLKSIDFTAFSECTHMKSISIPNSVTNIGEYAFSCCTSLTSITIPNSITSIEQEAFENCTSLNKVVISDIEAWCKIKFGSDAENEYNQSSNPLHFAHKLYLNDKLITNLVIPDNVTSIGNETFDGCSSLTSVIIHNNVTNIGTRAFSDCAHLKFVTIGNGVTNIGHDAFENCTSLDKIFVSDIAAWCKIKFGSDAGNDYNRSSNLNISY